MVQSLCPIILRSELSSKTFIHPRYDSSRHRHVLSQVIVIPRSAPPSIDSTYEIFDGAGPSDQDVFFPCGMLQREAKGHAGGIDADGDADYGIACFFRVVKVGFGGVV